MKVTLEKNYKDYYTLADLERAKAVIASEKEYDDMTPKDWANTAVNILANKRSDYCEEILQATATTAKNRNAYNLYGDDTLDMDVWINFIAKTSKGFIEGGAYLSDIWNICSDDDRTYNMFCRYFTEAER